MSRTAHSLWDLMRYGTGRLCKGQNTREEEATRQWESEQIHGAKLTLQDVQNAEQGQEKLKRNRKMSQTDLAGCPGRQL